MHDAETVTLMQAHPEASLHARLGHMGWPKAIAVAWLWNIYTGSPTSKPHNIWFYFCTPKHTGVSNNFLLLTSDEVRPRFTFLSKTVLWLQAIVTTSQCITHRYFSSHADVFVDLHTHCIPRVDTDRDPVQRPACARAVLVLASAESSEQARKQLSFEWDHVCMWASMHFCVYAHGQYVCAIDMSRW